MSPINIADILLLLVYGGVSFYFTRRFLLFRKWPSLGIAALPLGWIVLVVDSLVPPLVVIAAKAFGIILGIVLLAAVVSTDRLDAQK